MLAGRYRLHDRLPALPGDPDEVERWLALDEVLAREVDVLLRPAHGRRAPAGRELLESAATAGTVRSPVLLAVYDAALEAVPAERYGRSAGTADVAYVVSERTGGTTLGERLAEDGPFDPAEVLDLAVPLAEAVQAAHARGVVHGAVGPATVVLPPDGGVRLRDTAVAATLLAREEGEPPEPADDVAAVAACVYAMLTARWPEQATRSAGAGLPAAPLVASSRLCSPRQVRAGVPRAVDTAVQRVLEPGARPPVGTADELVELLRSAREAQAAAAAAHEPHRRSLPEIPAPVRRYLPAALVVLLLVVVAVGGYTRGRELGTVVREEDSLEALVDSTPSPVPGQDGSGGQRVDLAGAGVTVRAFDPPPGDGRENDAAVANAVDGDAGTAWESERYDTSRFGGLKQGVGLLVDLGRPTAVEQVELGLEPGADIELRVADAPPTDPAAMPVVATVANTEAVARLVPEQPVTAQFVLVWFTRLPEQDDGFRAAVREMFLVGP